MHTTFHFGFHRDSTDDVATHKLALKKETLRQLTDGELRRVAGGASTSISAAPSTRQSSGTSVISSGTSVISSGTSVISSGTSVNPSGG